MQAKTFGEKLMKRTAYGVRVEGVDVVMTLGEKACRMDYLTAFRLSAFLRASAKHAKKMAGDGALRIWTPSADLTDANLDEMEAQKMRDGTAAFSGRVR